jgi:hypothetical protein
MATVPRISENSDSSLLIATQRVKAYRERDALMEQHAQAMECRDCEDFLQAGIEAYKWLRQADESLREAAKAGFDVGEEAKQALDTLYRCWLDPCEHAERRIQEQQKVGFPIANLPAFREACTFVERQVRKQEMCPAIEQPLRDDTSESGL